MSAPAPSFCEEPIYQAFGVRVFAVWVQPDAAWPWELERVTPSYGEATQACARALDEGAAAADFVEQTLYYTPPGGAIEP